MLLETAILCVFALLWKTTKTSMVAKFSSPNPVVCIRLDKIGDLVLTLGADTPFKDNASVLPSLYDQPTWIISSGLGVLCELSSPKRKFLELPTQQGSWKSFHRLYSFLKETHPDLVLIFYAPWWASLASLLARVPYRIGRRSQWWSFLFLNKGLRQKRSLSEKHELEYNLDLSHYALSCFGIKDQKRNSLEQSYLSLNPPPLRHLLEQQGLKPYEYLVVHPGMKGSALNWNPDQYSHLVEKLSQKYYVVITGTESDSFWVTPLLNKFKDHPRVLFLYQQLNLKELLYILKFSQGVVVPSTGVAHLAASTGAFVVGLYPENKQQSPVRWRPLGAQVTLVTSDQKNLESISVERVVETVIATISGSAVETVLTTASGTAVETSSSTFPQGKS
jgi:heptosyltransferase I